MRLRFLVFDKGSSLSNSKKNKFKDIALKGEGGGAPSTILNKTFFSLSLFLTHLFSFLLLFSFLFTPLSLFLSYSLLISFTIHFFWSLFLIDICFVNPHPVIGLVVLYTYTYTYMIYSFLLFPFFFFLFLLCIIILLYTLTINPFYITI